MTEKEIQDAFDACCRRLQQISWRLASINDEYLMVLSERMRLRQMLRQFECHG